MIKLLLMFWSHFCSGNLDVELAECCSKRRAGLSESGTGFHANKGDRMPEADREADQNGPREQTTTQTERLTTKR